jgi:penicillin-binding protein 2
LRRSATAPLGSKCGARLIRSYPNGEVASARGNTSGASTSARRKPPRPAEEDQPTTEVSDHRQTGAEQHYERELHVLTGFEQQETSAGVAQVVRPLEHAG